MAFPEERSGPGLVEHFGPAEGTGRWTRPFGMLRPVDEIAVLTRRYMHEYGATREHLANVAVAVRGHANRNPARDMYSKPMPTTTTWQPVGYPNRSAYSTTASRPTAPLACVIVSAERAKDSGSLPLISTRSPKVCRHSIRRWSTSSTTTRSPDLHGHAPRGSGRTPSSGLRMFTSLSSTTRSPHSSSCRSRDTGSAERGEAAAFSENGNLEWGTRGSSCEYIGRWPLGGVRPRLQSDHRRREADAWHFSISGRGCRDLPRDVRRRRADERSSSRR